LLSEIHTNFYFYLQRLNIVFKCYKKMIVIVIVTKGRRTIYTYVVMVFVISNKNTFRSFVKIVAKRKNGFNAQWRLWRRFFLKWKKISKELPTLQMFGFNPKVVWKWLSKTDQNAYYTFSMTYYWEQKKWDINITVLTFNVKWPLSVSNPTLNWLTLSLSILGCRNECK
jgi:hypothetical protein